MQKRGSFLMANILVSSLKGVQKGKFAVYKFPSDLFVRTRVGAQLRSFKKINGLVANWLGRTSVWKPWQVFSAPFF